MRRTRHVIAVMVVATALCADRAISAAPRQIRTQSTRLAEGFASRLASSLRRTVSTVHVTPVRTQESVHAFPLAICQTARGVRSDFSPFQFRLPPPTL